MSQRLILAETSGGETVAIGPVFTDGGVERIYAQVEDAGWINRGVIRRLSLAQFAAESGGAS